MSQPRVSFVVPCFDYGAYLRDCLESIFAQEGDYEIEVIAIDDCSSDNSLEILLDYRDGRLRVLRNEVNRGHVFTVNRGLEESRGRYVVRIDPDDRYRRHFLRKTIPILERDPDLAVVYGNVALMDATGTINQIQSEPSFVGGDYKGWEFVNLLKKNHICAPTVVARREAWMSAWPIPEGLAFNDWYFNIMLSRRGQFYHVDEVLADYRVHGSNWHTKISRDGSEERSVLYLLGRVYEETESHPHLEAEKRASRKEIYASQYLDFADKYLWHGLKRDARRCYLKAISYQPRLLLKGTVARRLAGTIMPGSTYERLKAALRPPAEKLE